MVDVIATTVFPQGSPPAGEIWMLATFQQGDADNAAGALPFVWWSPNTSRVATQECETGSAGIGVITQLAEALAVDPAELFTPDLPGGQLQRATLTEISSRLASLSESELLWLKSLIEAALRPKG